jgi:hypothetical protein
VRQEAYTADLVVQQNLFVASSVQESFPKHLSPRFRGVIEMAKRGKGRPNTCKIVVVNGVRRKLCFDKKGRVRSNTAGGHKRKR